MASAAAERRVPPPRALRLPHLPTLLPVFPLGGALLLPRGGLPLNVFEPRYQCLVEDALRGDRLFGMIQPSDGHEETGPRAAPISRDLPPALFGVGCVGRLTSFAERADGTCSIGLTGVARFRVLREQDAVTPYRQLHVSYDEFADDLVEPDSIAFDRPGLLQALRRFFAARGFQGRWDAIEQMDDDTLLVTLSMICPFPPTEKQALLEAPTLSDRARTLRALLEMAGHESPEDDGRPPSA
ncbi:MAG: LON peptidase substrate-binding domain-containing protein [Gluconacetobacter diazotrophicus]|nr:LON peptidase substrate-binding domain-containing protein [Gluconacetobacter diazotrophicus]